MVFRGPDLKKSSATLARSGRALLILHNRESLFATWGFSAEVALNDDDV